MNKDTFLSSVRNNLKRAVLPEATAQHPGSFQGYTFTADATPEQLLASFKQELEALSGKVHLASDQEGVIEIILEILQSHQSYTLLAWDEAQLGIAGLGAALTKSGVEVKRYALAAEAELRKTDLAGLADIAIGLSGAQGGLADTGAIALVSGPGRGRLASLLPPVHIALLPKSKLYPALPAFLTAQPEVTALGSNLVFIAGPSRTGDIELTLTMGVHGPGEIHVIVTD